MSIDSKSSKEVKRQTKEHFKPLSGRKRVFPDITIEIESDLSESSLSAPKRKDK